MKYILNTNNNPTTDQSDCLVIPVFTKNKKNLLDIAGTLLDKANSGSLNNVLDKGDFKADVGNTIILHDVCSESDSSRVLLMGCGDITKFDVKQLNKSVKAVSKELKKTAVKTVSLYLLESDDSLINKNQAITQTAIAFADNHYELLDYKSKKENDCALQTISISCVDGFNEENKTALINGVAITQGMKVTRDLANHPGNVCTPTFIAQTAEIISNDYKNIEINVLEESDMEKLGMGSFLSVSKGSDEPGKMIILQYFGAKDKGAAPVALVGKGVTFDTGGISLKPGAKMDEMKFDMGGAAGMLGTLKACAEMQLALNLVVVLAAAENMPSARASKPGDIVTSMQGTTIEVLNTDAEGRLVLCDALTYVAKFKPAVVIDAATLTGACIVALGHQICALLSNNDELANDLVNAGLSVNDQTWRLPMNNEYKKQLKSAFADLGNIGDGGAGTITAACFLGEFTKDYNWAHLDIAGTAWDGKHATGRPVPLLSQYLINRVKHSS